MRLHPYTGEPLTPDSLRVSYAEALRTRDRTLGWLLDQLVADDPELRAVRDEVADAAVRKSSESIRIGRLEVRHG